jgi:hypothetical protein
MAVNKKLKFSYHINTSELLIILLLVFGLLSELLKKSQG